MKHKLFDSKVRLLNSHFCVCLVLFTCDLWVFLEEIGYESFTIFGNINSACDERNARFFAEFLTLVYQKSSKFM